MQNIGNIPRKNYTPSVHGTIGPQSSQIKFFYPTFLTRFDGGHGAKGQDTGTVAHLIRMSEKSRGYVTRERQSPDWRSRVSTDPVSPNGQVRT
jgi:hypothetical protein